MNPSETVQAAQRLQISGALVATGGEVPRLEIECDNGEIVTVANLPATLLSEMPMLLYKRVRLVVEADACPCGDRDSSACPGQWEPGCDLGANDAHAVPAPPEAAEALRVAMQTGPAPEDAPEDAERRFGPITSDPADAERNIREKEDAERAAYLYRWRNAPEWAVRLMQFQRGHCMWAGSGFYIYAGHNLLGSVRCEPRPQPVEDPERAAYLARWERAPEWAEWRSEYADGSVFWLPYAPACIRHGWKCEPRPVQGVGP